MLKYVAPKGLYLNIKGLFFLSNQGNHLALVWYGDMYSSSTHPKIPLKGYCMILKKKMKNFIFQFLDENLLSAWFKDERPQGLSWQSALKGYYSNLWQNIKICFSSFFPLWKWFWYYLRVRARKTNVKNSIKRILYDFDTILWQKYKNRSFGGFYPYENGFWYYLRVRARKS